MKKKPKPRRFVTVHEALETAYWLHWSGDEAFARRLLMRIADFEIRKDPDGKGPQEISLW